MKTIKRIISVVLITSLVLSLFGCNSKNGNDDIYELTVYDQNSNFTGELTGWFADILKEKFNVKLNFVNSDNSYFDVNLATSDLGDLLIFLDDGSNFRDSMSAGLLFDFNEDDILKINGSFLNTNLTASLNKSMSISEDNTLYGVYTNCSSSSDGYTEIANSAYIRWDLYAELGYPEINTLEDLTDVLRDMVELEPTNAKGSKTYGMTAFKDWDSEMPYLLAATAQLYGYEMFGFGFYNLNTSEYEECLDDDGMYMRLLKFYNNLYREGLLDVDSMNQTESVASNKVQSGSVMFGMTGYISPDVFNTETNIEAGKEMLPIAATDFKNYAFQNNIYGGNTIMCIGENSAYPDVCMEIINWLYTTEGMLTLTYGPQGVIWDFDNDGVPYITDTGWTYFDDPTLEMPEGYTGTYAEGISKLGISTWHVNSEILGLDGITYDYSTWPTTEGHETSSVESEVTDTVRDDWTSHNNAESVDTYLEQNDNLIVREASSYSVTPVPTDLMVYYNLISESLCQYSWLAIYAESDEEFDSIISEMKEDITAREYDSVMEYLNTEIQSRISAEDKN